MRKFFSLRAAMFAAIAMTFMFGTSGVIATDEDNPLDRSNVEASYAEIDEMISDMQGALASAESALSDVESMSVEDASRAADEFFQQMKEKVNLMLERLGPNSVLMDNLEGAKTNVIVFKRWYERQPADYPNRDDQVMRLEETLEDYDQLAAHIFQGRQDAQSALTELARAQFIRRMELKVDSVERSVGLTRRVLESLQSLGSGIRKVAEQEVPSSIPE